ncbi:uncharacterized protein LOC126655828 isoform X2 [Mercurialis annua]|uniref:uncharacterized protein LOC126655828 isoform X2 n=1 Tax=Mercurialis annua TaxID=3986 RepID=UPI0021600D2B|nr:uncharacterized protein LOC126655828 isoform X2 [Mercurialis annua]
MAIECLFWGWGMSVNSLQETSETKAGLLLERAQARPKRRRLRREDFILAFSIPMSLSELSTLKSYTHLLVSIPSVVGVGDPLLQHEELLRSTLMDGNLQWLCYLSSTSVYGDYGGAWVDEDYPTSPTSESAKSRLAAEAGWLKLGASLGISTQVFRLGGIYGPGRSAVDTTIKQEPFSRSQKMRISKKYTSRVHVDDICQALKASINRQPFRLHHRQKVHQHTYQQEHILCFPRR